MDKQQREYIHHLMLQYSDAMVRLTYRRVGDWHLAEDLVQETFLTACCKSERVCGHKKPVAWLFETLNNLTLRESRRFYHTEVSIEDIAESYELTELPVACHIPMGLSGSEQEIILLRIDKGYSFLELAEHFGMLVVAEQRRRDLFQPVYGVFGHVNASGLSAARASGRNNFVSGVAVSIQILLHMGNDLIALAHLDAATRHQL